MKLKRYTVIWSKQGMETFDMKPTDNDIIPLDEDKVDIWVDQSRNKKGRPVKRLATVYPVFETEKEALAYTDGNEDFRVVPCEITI